MKAIVCTAYGSPDVLQMKEIVRPPLKDNEVSIQIRATTVTSGDCRMRSAKVPFGFGFFFRLAFGLTKPRKPVLGTELAGVIDAIGAKVTRFQVGDRVFAFPGARCGAYAEFLHLSETAAIVHTPAGITDDEAASISFGGTTALFFLRDLAKIQPGSQVLINGAAGGIGSFAVQIAKHLKARVTGVCGTANRELVLSLGAERVIDYTKEAVVEGGEGYDVIFDTIGKLPFSLCKKALQPQGKYLNAAAGLPDFARMLWTAFGRGKKVLGGVVPERLADLVLLKEWIEAGHLRVVIDRRFPLEAAAEAHRYVDLGHKKGSVVLQVRGNESRESEHPAEK